jgi:tRNA(Ile)-lysidine synthase
MKSKLVKNFKNFIFQEKLFSGGESLIVGISGGADSVCLVELLLAVQKKFDLELRLVHINYHLRGKESDEDAVFIEDLAEKWGVGLTIVDYKEGNPAFAGRSANLEERLRDFRYEVFEKVRVENKADWIVVAHHRDDQVETFLMNLFRGAGVDGLKGMRIKSEQRRILRPLLNFGKDNLKEFLESIEQGWREDKSNEDNIFLRNRIRNELIPEIEKRYSSKFKERVAGVTRQLQKHSAVVRKSVSQAFAGQEFIVSNVVELDGDRNVLEIDVERYEKLDDEIKPLVFREVIRMLKGDLKNISENNYLEFEKIMRSRKGKRQVMEMGKLKFEKIGEKMRVNEKHKI